MVSTHVHRERWSGPSIEHAAGDAAIWMGQRAFDDDDVQRRLDLGREVSSAGFLDGPPWMERVGQVDGQSVAFRFREEGDAWAAVVALGQVSVGVAGWGYDFTEYPLSVVDPYSYRLVGYDLFRP
jgi:hypothetical protein